MITKKVLFLKKKGKTTNHLLSVKWNADFLKIKQKQNKKKKQKHPPQKKQQQRFNIS